MFRAFFITLSKDQKHCGHFILSYDLRYGDQENLLWAVGVDGWHIHCSCFLNLHIETSTDMLLVHRWRESRNSRTFFTYCVNSTAPDHGYSWCVLILNCCFREWTKFHSASINSKLQHLPPLGNSPVIWTFEDWFVQTPPPPVIILFTECPTRCFSKNANHEPRLSLNWTKV